jgi:signal transduction histidine kinase
MEVGAEIEERWARWLVERNRRGLRVGLAIIATLYPAFGLLDWLMAPREALPWLWGTRALVALGAIAVFPLVHRPGFARWVEPLSAAYAWLAAAGIIMMTIYMGGMASPYYAGLTLVVIASGLLMVWRPALVLATNSLTVVTFVGANLAFGSVGRLSIALSNLAFLSAVALIAGVGQVMLFFSEREQHAQRVQLERATAKLERAHADLQRLDAFKSRFVANMTHELRTPLAMILTPLELLLEGELGRFSEPERQSFGSMYRSALKLLKLINDLLDLSRLEESRLRLHVADHELVAYLRTLVEQSQVLARRRDIALSFTPAVGRAVVRCDLERLERVVVNLLSNAIKFTPSGGHVAVSLSETAEEVEISVLDDGPGFPPEKAERLFERFYQLDMEATRQHGGAGIGLALARELVQLHGGAVRGESDGVHGARFVVTLPKRHAFAADEVVADGAGPPDSSPRMDWTMQLERRDEFRLLYIDEATDRRVVERDADEEARPHTALVVEDSAQVLQIVHMSLRREFKVLTAPDGQKALELVAREQPSLVVTDLMMPGMDGLELTRRLRAEPRTRHIPILMLTARGEVEDRVKGLETGVSAYLTKPFSPRELITCARQLVRAEEDTAELVLTRRMESIEMVAAGLAHEMNNPLNYARNALARVKLDAERAVAIAAQAVSEPLSERDRVDLERTGTRIQEMLAVATSGLVRIGRTVELLGRYGRAGFRRDLVALDAWDALRTVADIVLPATGRAVEVMLDLEGDGTLECVPEEFNQVVTNLVQNAIEAVPDGGRVAVLGRVEGDTLAFSVKDDGPGITPEVQARLFTPFFTTKGEGSGMGLGLTIARRVVQSLGGTLAVTSTPGAGAEFKVRVPRRQRRDVGAPALPVGRRAAPAADGP